MVTSRKATCTIRIKDKRHRRRVKSQLVSYWHVLLASSAMSKLGDHSDFRELHICRVKDTTTQGPNRG